jgi:hypothetical protein
VRKLAAAHQQKTRDRFLRVCASLKAPTHLLIAPIPMNPGPTRRRNGCHAVARPVFWMKSSLSTTLSMGRRRLSASSPNPNPNPNPNWKAIGIFPDAYQCSFPPNKDLVLSHLSLAPHLPHPFTFVGLQELCRVMPGTTFTQVPRRAFLPLPLALCPGGESLATPQMSLRDDPTDPIPDKLAYLTVSQDGKPTKTRLNRDCPCS